jgi:hypothetical protein
MCVTCQFENYFVLKKIWMTFHLFEKWFAKPTIQCVINKYGFPYAVNYVVSKFTCHSQKDYILNLPGKITS